MAEQRRARPPRRAAKRRARLSITRFIGLPSAPA
jgi:hypothetical protein